MGFEPTHTGATTLGLNRLTIPTIQCSSFFRATASSVSLRLSHILRYAPSSSLTIPCISKKILRIQHLFSELLRHSFLPSYGQEDVPVFQLGKLATENGLEPSTSSVTGWHSNQLNYSAINNGGRNRARTYDPLLVRQMLSQLSYTPLTW